MRRARERSSSAARPGSETPAPALAERGYRLALGDIDGDGVEALAAGIRSSGGDAHAFVLDVADAEAVRRLAKAGAASLGGLDAVWSNVGVQITGSAEEVTVEDLDRLWSINVRAHAVLCGSAIPHLRAAGRGAMLITASNSALLSEARVLPYVTTKAAALALARQIARDYAPERIRVNALRPGWVDTPFNEPAWANFGGKERFLEAMPELVPLGRTSTAEEIAKLACFLLSDDAAYVTGHAFVADGGGLLVA